MRPDPNEAKNEEVEDFVREKLDDKMGNCSGDNGQVITLCDDYNMINRDVEAMGKTPRFREVQRGN